MADDYYSRRAQARLQQLEAARMQELVNIQNSKNCGDDESAELSLGQLALINLEKAGILQLHQEYVASQTPPTPPEMTAEEKAAKPWDKMTYDDALDLAKTSKYGKNLSHNDPAVQAGYRDVMARRARGE